MEYTWNNYFNVGLKAWRSNMEIKPVFNWCKAVTYICQHFTKTENQCSQVMKQTAKCSIQIGDIAHWDLFFLLGIFWTWGY